MNRFLSFADSRMAAALERLGRQAEALEFFDEITLFTEHDLSAEFTGRMGKYLTPSCRGFGYWSWKPWAIHHVLQDMQEGDRLLYLDAGCHININGAKRFWEYVDMLDRDSRGMLVFTNGQPEYKWTKGDILRHFGVSGEDVHVTHTQQIAGGHVFLPGQARHGNPADRKKRLAAKMQAASSSRQKGRIRNPVRMPQLGKALLFLPPGWSNCRSINILPISLSWSRTSREPRPPGPDTYRLRNAATAI